MFKIIPNTFKYNSLSNAKLSKLKFAVFRPSGNDTALIHGVIQDSKLRKIIADAIQNKYLNVEQVGFINNNPQDAELMMTGGEFCGNATSSAAYQILSGRPGEIKIKVSGVRKKLIAGVTEKGESFSQMPVYSDPSYIRPDVDSSGNFLVTLEGITHYVDFDVHKIKGLTIDEIKIEAKKKMQLKGLDQNSACGIIYTEKVKDTWVIYPVVYVKNADTLYYETACGSGTTALGLILALKNRDSINEIPVIQPSGLTIKVSVEFNNTSFGFVKIQSRVRQLGNGILTMDESSKISFESLLNRLIHI